MFATQSAETTSATTSSQAPTATTAPPATLPPQLVAHVGETFDDGGHYTWRIEASQAFTCVAQPPTSKSHSVGFVVTPSNSLWATLCAIAIRQLAPQAPPAPTRPAPAPAPAPAPTTPAPAPTTPPASTAPSTGGGFSLEGFLLSLLSGVLPDIGSLIGIGGPDTATPGGTTPAPTTPGPSTPGPTTPGPTTPVPTPEPKNPASDPGAPTEIHAMSQFVWYGAGYEDLKPAQVVTASQVLAEVFKLGTAAELVTTPTPAVQQSSSNNPNHGYWWFTADGSQTWSGGYSTKSGFHVTGTQYVLNDIPHTERANQVSRYLSRNPPGGREPFMKEDGKGGLVFDMKGGTGWTPVRADAVNLNLRNVPGSQQCFATAEAVIAQAGMTEVANGSADEIKGIVTSTTYFKVPDHHGKLLVDQATVDAAASLKAKTYIEWQTQQGKPVMAGVRYDNSGYNSGNADHFLVISGRKADGQYTFVDPAAISTDDASHDDYVFVWQDGMLAHAFAHDRHDADDAGRKRYVVSYVRPNNETLPDWQKYWAQNGPKPGGK